MKVFLGLLLNIAFSLASAEAAHFQAPKSHYEILGRWALPLLESSNPIERFQSAHLAGLTLDENQKYFYLSAPPHFVEKRSVALGALEWKFPLVTESQAAWTLNNGDIFGGDTEGNLYALDAGTGKKKFIIPPKTPGIFFSRPLVGEKLFWVMASNGSLQTFDRTTGHWLWQQSDPNPKSLSLWSYEGPIFFKNSVLAGFPSEVLQAFDPVSGGKPLWSESFSSGASSGESFNDLKSVASDNDYLFASSFNGDLKAWSGAGGGRKLLWEKRLSLYAPVSIDTSAQLIYASDRDGNVQAFEMMTGLRRWSVGVPKGLATQVAISDRYLWFGTSGGKIFVYSKSGEKIAESNEYESAVWNAPTLLKNDEALVITEGAIIRRIHLTKVR